MSKKSELIAAWYLHLTYVAQELLKDRNHLLGNGEIDIDKFAKGIQQKYNLSFDNPHYRLSDWISQTTQKDKKNE